MTPSGKFVFHTYTVSSIKDVVTNILIILYSIGIRTVTRNQYMFGSLILKGSHTQLCLSPIETQEDLLIFPGLGSVKRVLLLDCEEDFIKFLQRISVKLQGRRLSTQ